MDNVLKNPFQRKVEKVLIDFPMMPKNVTLKLRIRFTHSQDTILRNQKYGRTMLSPSRMYVQTVDGNSLYLTSSPVIDFPFNMKNMDGKFDSKTTMYLSHLHMNSLKQTLRSMLQGIHMRDLFFFMNNQLHINEEIAQNSRQFLPIRGVMLEFQYCIIREMTGNNEYSSYEGIRIINPSLRTIAELTVDELDGLIDTLDSINIGQLIVSATTLGLNLIKLDSKELNDLFIPRQQLISV